MFIKRMSNSQLQNLISLYTAFAFVPTLLLYLIYSIFGWVVFSLTLNPFLGYFLVGGAYGLWSLHSLIKTMKNLTVLKHESPRVCQRLNNLRNWNYEKIKSLYIRIS